MHTFSSGNRLRNISDTEMCVFEQRYLGLYIQKSVATGGPKDQRKEQKFEKNGREIDLESRGCCTQ